MSSSLRMIVVSEYISIHLCESAFARFVNKAVFELWCIQYCRFGPRSSHDGNVAWMGQSAVLTRFVNHVDFANLVGVVQLFLQINLELAPRIFMYIGTSIWSNLFAFSFRLRFQKKKVISQSKYLLSINKDYWGPLHFL